MKSTIDFLKKAVDHLSVVKQHNTEDVNEMVVD